MKKLYTTKEVAKILGYHPEYIRHLVRSGKLKKANARGNNRFTDDNIRDFLEGGKEDD